MTKEKQNNEMTPARNKLLMDIMEWYWKEAKEGYDTISKSDYEFIYAMRSNGLSYYGESLRGRLNDIRNKFVKAHRLPQTKHEITRAIINNSKSW